MIVQRTFVGPSTSAFKGSSVNGSSLILSSRYLTMKPKGNLVTELIGDLAGTLETTTELLRLLVGGHDPPFSLSMMGHDQAWVSSQGLDDAVGPRREFARRFTEGSRKHAGRSPEEDRKTHRKNVRGYRIRQEASDSPIERRDNPLSIVCVIHTIGKPQFSLPSIMKKWLCHPLPQELAPLILNPIQGNK
ncbi:hypothetical protein BHM03_00037252 [Ensete ventricosum]|nr:hypothetical protein BHM03_00037252 [Ensete ventricosum]